jgi:hypothetical protein
MALLKAGSKVGGVNIADVDTTDMLEDLIKGDNAKGTGTTGHNHNGTNSLAISSPPTRSITTGDSVVASDCGKILLLNGTFTLTTASAATLGNGFVCKVKLVSGVVTFDPAGSEVLEIPGVVAPTSITLPYIPTGNPADACYVDFTLCSDGTHLYVLDFVDIVHGSNTYDTAGTFSWTCPSGITKVRLIGSGGGGGGGCGNYNPTYKAGGGGSSGCGDISVIDVVPGQSYSLTVGAAGTGSTSYTGQAGDGGTSSFGSGVKTWLGGDGGYGAGHATHPQEGGVSTGTGSTAGDNGNIAVGGDGGDSVVGNYGGEGGYSSGPTAPTVGLYGSGGGGGSMAQAGGVYAYGKDGGAGYIKLEW